MDSEDSRDDSSASESNDGGPQSPDSIKSPDGQSNRSHSRSRSRSRSSTPSSRDGSAASRRSSDSSPQSPDNENNMKSPASDSDRSRSSSPENNRIDSPKDRGSPVPPKHGNRKTLPIKPRSPDSPNLRKSQSPRSPGGKDSAPQSPPSPRQTPESPVNQSNIAHSPVNQYDTPDSPPQLDTPDSPPHQNETPDSPFQHETPESPVQNETPESPVQHETPDSPLQRETPDSPLQRETPDSPLQRDTPDSPLQRETPDSPLQRETPDSPVQHETPDSPVQHETPDSPVPHETPDSPVQPEYPDSPTQQPPSPDSPIRKPKSPQSVPADDVNHSSRSSSPASPVRNKSVSQSPRRNRSQSNDSVKSDSSYESRKSRTRSRHSSRKSRSSRSNSSSSSDSSDSSVDTPRKRNQHPNKNADTQPEEISDGDIELDQEKDQTVDNKASKKNEINISHEDLSDVSDLEDSMGDHSEDDRSNQRDNKNGYEPERISTKEEKNNTHDVKKQMIETNNRSEEAEEQLDFEAEDGECEADPPSKDKDDGDEKETVENKKVVEEKPLEEKEELEEGEVTDEDDVRPEETEPRPVCRFFSRGQCTWGASCRFLHPGVTDKGNYTMFDLIRPVVAGEFGRDERMYGKVAEPPLVETAWERGLRTAKEMLRKSTKRKEQDIDFEEKKMNLTLAQEEFDKENGYYGRVASPEPRYVRHVSAVDYPPVARAPPIDEYYPPRRQIAYEADYAHPVPRERVRPSYRELPSHRIPDYYDDKYAAADDHSSKKGRGASKREVIVQRVPEERESRPERERPPGRGDEWQDPWMRVRSPAGGGGSNRRRGRDRKRSYSSGSTYSSSSSSRSSSNSSRSSTYRSRSITPRRRRRSRSRRSRHVSPSVIVSERKAANERAALMNPPAPKRRAPSPGMVRVSAAANPPAPLREDRHRSKLAVAAALARVKSAGRKSSKSSSGSSGSSSSDSESSDSSSSSSRAGSSPGRRPPGVDLSLVKAMDALKGGSLEKKQIKLNLKNPVGAIKKSDIAEFARKTEAAATQAKKRPATSPPQGDSKSKKATSRREELLKQLKAVEDAIAKKRSKVN